MEVVQWLHTNGFGSSTQVVAALNGSHILAMSADELQALTPQGSDIYTNLHGMLLGIQPHIQRHPNDIQRHPVTIRRAHHCDLA